MIIVTFVCDNCDKKQADNKDMFALALGMKEASANGLDYFNITNSNAARKGVWCKECCDKLGLGQHAPKVEAPITLEDIIKSMIEEYVDNRNDR